MQQRACGKGQRNSEQSFNKFLHTTKEAPKNNSMDYLVEEVASQLDKANVPWLVIELGERGEKNDQSYSTWTDLSNIQKHWPDKTFQGRPL